MKRILALILCFAMCFSLTACFEKPTVESFIAQTKEGIESSDDIGELKLLARENSMVYSYQYKIDLGVENSVAATAMEAALVEKEATYTDMLAQLKAAVKSAESVIVEFLDKDGNVIFTKEYK